MKQNKYDDEIFFEKYSEMDRSKKGLSGAGEWETLKQLLPDFTNKKVLDLGCGYGWHCSYAIEKGAKHVIGIDISEKMLQVAKEKNNHESIEYMQGTIEDIDFDENEFDIILSSLALHYIEDYASVVEKVKKVLKPNGIFIFSAEHPDFTAEGSQNWYYNDNNEILHFPLDNYFIEGKRKAIFLGEEVIKYHRTLTTYVNTLLESGFRLLRLVEPQPSAELLENVEGMKDELRRPMMLIISAENIK